MGSRLFDEIREQRGLCYSVYAVDHAAADVGILQLGSGLESSKCGEAYTRMREIVAELAADGPTEEEVERARAYAAGRRVLAFENTNAVARYAAGQQIVFGEHDRPRRGDRRAGPRHLRARSSRRPRGSTPTSSPSRSWGRTRPTSSRRARSRAPTARSASP